MRACLVRELQLLFLHVMGEARDCALGPGMESPPPLQSYASITAEVRQYCLPLLYSSELTIATCSALFMMYVKAGIRKQGVGGTKTVSPGFLIA